MRGVVFRGRRYDTGDRLDYLKAVVRLAAERPDLGPDFLAWLRAWVDGADGGGESPREVRRRAPGRRAWRGCEALPPLDLQLLEAHGCVLTEDVAAPTDLPAWDNSGMDGYAVRQADVARAGADTPVRLPVVGDIPAGSRVRYRVQPGQCVRIMTGAPIPDGADSVVPVEWTDRGTEPSRSGRRRRRGSTCAPAAATYAPATSSSPPARGSGRRTSPCSPRSGLARPVRPRPRVVMVSTGSELVEAGQPARPGQIPDANGSR